MKINVIGSFDGYFHMGVWVANGLEDLGHEVGRIDRNFIHTAQPADIQLFVDCSEDFSPHIPNLEGIKVFWSLDSHMPGGIQRSVNIANKCDYTFCTNDEYGARMMRKFGFEPHLLPITYSNRLVDTKPIRFPEKDIVMIGNRNSLERARLWDLLNKHYKAFCGPAKTDLDYVSLMTYAKIVVNQPTEPWDIILNNRFFEALGFGSFLLQKRLQTGIVEEMGFVDGEDFVYWTDFSDLKDKLDYYFLNPKERARIAINGNEKVQQYSMTKQLQKMLTIVE